MAFPRRLQKELDDLQKASLPYFTHLMQDDANVLVWQGLILPQSEPYSKGAFRVEFIFPPEYPFKPPQLSFKTKIYHPNIAEDGQVCLPLVNAENWKPTTRLDQVRMGGFAVNEEAYPFGRCRRFRQLVREFQICSVKFLKD